jgi:hypothetical protein
MVRRRELFVEPQPLITDISDHPWRSVAEEAASCSYSQLARPVRLDLATVLAGRVT